MPPKFLYFDLGNVLLNFDHRRAARQMAAVAGIEPDEAWRIVFEGDLEAAYEAGSIDSRQFYEHFCRLSGTRPEFAPLALAACDIFEVNLPVKPIFASLAAAGHRLGLLSNTNQLHWEFFSSGRYGLIPEAFEQIVLSFKVKSMKPEPAIFQTAIAKARVAPGEIFYVDDLPGHVAAARALGIDAVQYTNAAKLVDDLMERDVAFNY